MLPAKNNVYGVLAAAVSDVATSIPLLDASRFPPSGIAVLAGGLNPYVNEVVLYTSIVGNTLEGCTRGFDGTTAESHPSGAFIGLAIVAKHITDLQPKHGTTAARLALGLTLTVEDTGRSFYDTDEEELHRWVKDHWERPVISIGANANHYVGTAAAVLPLAYKAGDLWVATDANFKLRICRASPITNSLADWVSVGSQN